ncbi:MAG: aminopeptidase P family protein [Acetatifactor sp.]|nr:aminopeptidase P family protein [Acetatifactor sp.]
MTHLDMQDLNRMTIKYISENIRVGMSLSEVRRLCESYMLNHGADSFWYWGVGAFVFSGEDTILSVSGKQYQTADKAIQVNDIVTIDLSPQCENIWGDYARTIIIENGKVIRDVKQIQNSEWRQGLWMEEYLHGKLLKIATKDMTFEELYFLMNEVIVKKGFVNLDFLGNLGHSIVQKKSDRIYTERGNHTKLSEVEMFTFEPHISVPGSKYGYKREDIYYFNEGRLFKL